MVRDIYLNAIGAGFGLISLAMLVSEVGVFRVVGVWWVTTAASLSGSLHAPTLMWLWLVAFAPLFLLVFLARRTMWLWKRSRTR